MSSEMACRAASLTSAGAAKSGKPCERLTAPCFMARRVISRMTDSVNCSAFAEIMRREICAIFDSGLLIFLRQASGFPRFQGFRACTSRPSGEKVVLTDPERTDVGPEYVDNGETGCAAGA